jgi:DNA-directed RNA polymerase subunit RPC12/RpoP
MTKKSNARNDHGAKHINVLQEVISDCQDVYNYKFQESISIRFIPAIEFTCSSCKSLVVVKIESIEEPIVCPVCQHCRFTLIDIFNKMLEDAKRPTPHRKPSRRMSSEPTSKRAGRPSLDRVSREPTQITLHPDTIDILYELDVSRGELFEFLLNFFPPFSSILEKKKQK